jgi:hypothetical protein
MGGIAASRCCFAEGDLQRRLPSALRLTWFITPLPMERDLEIMLILLVFTKLTHVCSDLSGVVRLAIKFKVG